MLFEVLLECLCLSLALLFGFLFLARHFLDIKMGLLLHLSQLFFEFKLNVQQLVHHLRVELLQMLVWYLVEPVDLVRIVWSEGAFFFFLLDHGVGRVRLLLLVLIASS